MFAFRQVQHVIGRIQVHCFRGTVSDAGDRDLPEHRAQPTLVAVFDPGACHLIGADDVVAALFVDGVQVQTVLVELAHQLTGPLGEVILQHGMSPDLTVNVLQFGHHRREHLERPGERP